MEDAADFGGSLQWDPPRTGPSEDSPAASPQGSPDGARLAWWPFWSKDQRNQGSSSDGRPCAGSSMGTSPAKDLHHDEPGGRSYLKAGTATSWAKLESGLQVLKNSTHPLALEFLQTLERPIHIIAQLLTENQQLQQKQQSSQDDLVAQLLSENQRLQQELQALKSSQRVPEPQRSPHILANWIPSRWNTSRQKQPAFPVQLWITGQTNGCEKHFMDDVTRLLAGQGVSLQVEDYQEDSEHFLLLFCPIVSRMGTDIDNALEGLSSMRKGKALLIVCHYKPKSSIQSVISSRNEVQHPALVTTVHACYTIQDGFYHCQMNKEAVAAVASAIASELRRD